jgi:hypothetical protein
MPNLSIVKRSPNRRTTPGLPPAWSVLCVPNRKSKTRPPPAARHSIFLPTQFRCSPRRLKSNYRQGKIREAAGAADQASKIDPCNPRVYLIRARILRLNSMYAVERRAIGLAHPLDPSDIDIRGTWLSSLPLSQRIETTMLSKCEGSDVALNPRRINRIAMTLARIATTSSRRRKFLQRFMTCRALTGWRCAKALF